MTDPRVFPGSDLSAAGKSRPPGSPGFNLAAWVTESCLRQGVPVKVTDPLVLRRIAALLKV